MDIIELKHKEIINVSGGLSLTDGLNAFGGTVFAGLVSALVLPKIKKLGGKPVFNPTDMMPRADLGVLFGKNVRIPTNLEQHANKAMLFLFTGSFISLCLAVGGMVFGTIDELIRGKNN
jgi:hypothetical protein